MASFVPRHPDTAEDQRLYTEARLVQVACLDCLATVGVKKNSEHHTSIQWSADAVAACPEFGRRDRTSNGRDGYQACPRMIASIDAAAREGNIPIGAHDGY